MSTATFLQRCEELFGRLGWDATLSPWRIVELWEQLISRIDAGYRWGYYEFTNDIRVRDLLEEMMTDATLAEFPQVEEIRNRVARIDARLKSLFAENVALGDASWAWWHRGVLARAGSDYRADLWRLYEIDVEALET